MSDWYGTGGGSSSGSSGSGASWYGTSDSGSGTKKKKKKKKKESAVAHFFTNAAEYIPGHSHIARIAKGTAKGVEDLTIGTAKGLFNVGQVLGTAQKQHSFEPVKQLGEDLGKSIVNDYKYKFSPALHGDFKKTGRRLEEDPLGAVMDVLPIGKVAAIRGAKVARVAAPSSKLARVGYAKVASVDMSDVAAVGKFRREGNMVLRNGDVLKPKKITLETKAGKGVELTHRPNEWSHIVHQAYANLGNLLPSAPIVGANVRAGKHLAKAAESTKVNRQQIALAGYQPAAKALSEGEKEMHGYHLAGLDSKALTTQAESNLLHHWEKAANTTGKERKFHEAHAKQDAEVMVKLDKYGHLLDEPTPAMTHAKAAYEEHMVPVYEENYDRLHAQPLNEEQRILSAMEPYIAAHPEKFPNGAKKDDVMAQYYQLEKDGNAPVYLQKQLSSGEEEIGKMMFPDQMHSGGGKGKAKKSKGYLSEHLAYGATPDHLVRQFLSYDNFRSYVDSLDNIAKQGVVVDVAAGQQVPRGLAMAPLELETKLHAAKDFLTHDAKVIFGDSDELSDAVNHVDALSLMIRGTNGKRMAFPPKVLREMEQEIAQAESFAKKAALAPGRLWQHVTLFSSPRYAVNNFIGAYTMLAASRGLTRAVSGTAAYLAGKAGLESKTYQAQKMLDETAPHVRSGSFFNTKTGEGSTGLDFTMKEVRGAESMLKKLFAVGRIPTRQFGRLVEVISDDVPRRISFGSHLMEDARKLSKKTGDTVEESMDHLIRNPEKVDYYAERVFDDLIDYQDLSKTEKVLFRDFAFVLFYRWTKGITKKTARSIAESPEKWRGLLATVDVANEKDQSFVSQLPNYLKDLIVTGKHGDHVKGVQTAYLNPWAQVGSNVDLVKGLFQPGVSRGMETPLSVINPGIREALVGVTGKDPFTGARVFEDSNPMSRAFLHYMESFPQSRIINSYGKTESPKAVYAGDPFQNKIEGYIGDPRKTINLQNALDQAKQDKIKKTEIEVPVDQAGAAWFFANQGGYDGLNKNRKKKSNATSKYSWYAKSS